MPSHSSSVAPLPLGSLTLATTAGSTTTTTTASSTNTSTTRQTVLRARTPNTNSQRAAAAHLLPAPAAAAATRSTTQQQSRRNSSNSSRSKAFGRVPLAVAAALTFHVGRSAARALAPIVLSRQQHLRSRALGAARVLTSLLPRRIGGGGSSPPGVPGGRKPALVWFRSDLRLHDHEPLAAACAGATSLLPVYVFDPREYGKSPNGFDKTGPYRARFILEALADLRGRLRDAGSDLVVRIGKPEEVLPQLARAVGAGGVYCHGEVTAEEGNVEAAVAKALDKAGAALKVMWGGTLFHLDDLPFQLPAMPPHYSDFRRAVKSLAVRAPVEAPQQVKGLPAASVSAGELPSLQQLGFDAATLQRCASDKAAAGAQLRGGESEAMRRLSDFITHFTLPPAGSTGSSGGAGSSDSSSNKGPAAAEAPNFCCKISPWLALGCLSPRQLYGQLQRKLQSQGQQQQGQLRAAGQGSDTDMQWLLYELLWRDFFRFVTKKYAVTGLGQKGTPHEAAAAMAMA